MEKHIVSELCFECENCINCCPTNAIRLNGENIFIRKAVIDAESCIQCGRCEKVCPALNLAHIPLRETIEAYGVKSTHPGAQRSASGGLFFEIARNVLSQNGYVVGAAYQTEWAVATEVVSSASDLCKLQGSKYVKSYNGNSFSEIKTLIQSGKKVLIGGTPCQIAALYTYLGAPLKDSDNLITVDLVCHGCPPGKLFTNYISSLEEKKGVKVNSFQFRGQKYGAKHVGRYGWLYEGKQKWSDLYSAESSYFKLFLDGYSLAENCYHCPLLKRKGFQMPLSVTTGDGEQKVIRHCQKKVFPMKTMFLQS